VEWGGTRLPAPTPCGHTFSGDFSIKRHSMGWGGEGTQGAQHTQKEKRRREWARGTRAGRRMVRHLVKIVFSILLNDQTREPKTLSLIEILFDMLGASQRFRLRRGDKPECIVITGALILIFPPPPTPSNSLCGHQCQRNHGFCCARIARASWAGILQRAH